MNLFRIFKKRYFFASYYCENSITTARGSLWIESMDFPSNIEMKNDAISLSKMVGRNFEIRDVVITNLFEFKNKEDFENFINRD